MKKPISIFILIMAVIELSAQGLRFGVHFDPQFSWMNPQARDIKKSNTFIGINGGLIVENYFAENYAFSTGLELGNQGGSLKFSEPTTINVYNEVDSLEAGTTVDYRLQYISIPTGIKLKSNQIGYFTYFVMLGFTPQLNINAKGTSSDSDRTLDKDDISEEINLFNLAYHFGGGIEYAIGEDTAIILGILYHNGFLDVTKSGNAKVNSRVLAIRVGLMF